MHAGLLLPSALLWNIPDIYGEPTYKILLHSQTFINSDEIIPNNNDSRGGLGDPRVISSGVDIAMRTTSSFSFR
jgi:hypothetical protein